MKISLILMVASLLITPFNAYAGNASKSLDFEGDVIEGVNKQALDSLSQISEKEDNKEKLHLYQKRQSFKDENEDTLRHITEIK